jgi:alkylated DNA repair dioxygenase AlkB
MSEKKEERYIIKLLPLTKARVYYIPNFYTKEKALKYKELLLKCLLLGKKRKEGRRTALYGDAIRYKYAENDVKPDPWLPLLLEIKKDIEEFLREHSKVILASDGSEFKDVKYNVCLPNWYEDGTELFRFHRDREEIKNQIPIASLSFGAEREFCFKSLKEHGSDNFLLKLASGSLVIMDSLVHETHIHGVLADKSIKEDRLNLTYRFSRETEPLEGSSEIKTDRKTTVVNKKTTDEYDVYIGRSELTRFGNPFKFTKEKDREKALSNHKKYIDDKIKSDPDFLLEILSLRGKVLACSCKPKACHGDYLVEIIEKN